MNGMVPLLLLARLRTIPIGILTLHGPQRLPVLHGVIRLKMEIQSLMNGVMSLSMTLIQRGRQKMLA